MEGLNEELVSLDGCCANMTIDYLQSDVIKALCLGATAVGIGRPFLYAQSVSCSYGSCMENPVLIGFEKAYGVPGVVTIVEILQREILTAMRLLGVSSIKGLKPEMVCGSSTGVFNVVAYCLRFRWNVWTGRQFHAPECNSLHTGSIWEWCQMMITLRACMITIHGRIIMNIYSLSKAIVNIPFVDLACLSHTTSDSR